jgi:lysozyme family protein
VGGIALSLRSRSLLVPLALALVYVSTLVSARPADAATCWQRVLSDWRDGHIDGTYSPSCLRAAIVNMPEDLRIYGNAVDDITRLLNRMQAARLAASRTAASTSRPATTTTTTSKPAASSSGSRSLAGRKDKGRQAPVHRVAAAPEHAAESGGGSLPFRTLLLILAAVSGVAVLALASVRGLRG